MEIRFGDAAALTAALQKNAASMANPGEEIQILDGGETSSVVRAGDHLYKSPHSGVNDNDSVVRFEAAVATALPAIADLATGSVLAVPQLIATYPDQDPPYNVLRFVPGDILTMPTIAGLSEAAQTQLGRDLGSFVVWLDKTIPVDTFNDIQSVTPPATPMTLIDSLREFRLPHIQTIRNNGYNSTADLLEELTSTLPPPYQEHAPEPLVTGHGDLRPANLTFEEERLKGVFDFGCLFPTDPAEELRFTSFIGEAAVEAAIDQFYSETQIRISRQRLMYYASAQAMLSASFCAIHGSGVFRLSYRDLLDRQYPGRDWSELDAFSDFDAK